MTHHDASGTTPVTPAPPTLQDGLPPTSIAALLPQIPTSASVPEQAPRTPVHGFTSKQRRFLALRPLHGSDAETAAVADVDRATVAVWKRDPVFLEAWERAAAGELEEWAKGERRRLLGKALLVAEELLSAETERPLKGGGSVTVPDNLARAKGVELVLRTNGMWDPQDHQGPASPASEAFAALAALARAQEAEANERMALLARTGQLSDVAMAYVLGSVLDGQTVPLIERGTQTDASVSTTPHPTPDADDNPP